MNEVSLIPRLSPLRRKRALERGYKPGNEATSLGMRLQAWERGYKPGNEATSLGTRLGLFAKQYGKQY